MSEQAVKAKRQTVVLMKLAAVWRFVALGFGWRTIYAEADFCALMKARRSALMTSLLVEHMPWGRPG